MRPPFYLRTTFDEVWITLDDVAPKHGAPTLVAPKQTTAQQSTPFELALIEREEAAFSFRSWMGSGPSARALKVAIVEELSGAIARNLDDAALETRIESALSTGQIHAFRSPRAILGRLALADLGALEKEHREEPIQKGELTWIGIELVDEAHPHAPLAFARYRIELPNGRVREGMLDARGRAELTDIDPGSCKITFPDRHGEDWRAA